MCFKEQQRREAERKAEKLMQEYKSQGTVSKTQVVEEFAWDQDD